MIDRETPRGELLYPDAGTTEIGGSEYGFILRTDPTVTAVYYHITDSNDDNDTATVETAVRVPGVSLARARCPASVRARPTSPTGKRPCSRTST